MLTFSLHLLHRLMRCNSFLGIVVADLLRWLFGVRRSQAGWRRRWGFAIQEPTDPSLLPTRYQVDTILCACNVRS